MTALSVNGSIKQTQIAEKQVELKNTEEFRGFQRLQPA